MIASHGTWRKALISIFAFEKGLCHFQKARFAFPIGDTTCASNASGYPPCQTLLVVEIPNPHLRRKNSAATRLLNAFIKFNGSQENFSKKKQWVASTSSYLPPMLTRNIFTTIRPHRIGSDLYILQRSPMRPVLNFPFFSTVIIVEDHFNYAVNDLLKSFPLHT